MLLLEEDFESGLPFTFTLGQGNKSIYNRLDLSCFGVDAVYKYPGPYHRIRKSAMPTCACWYFRQDGSDPDLTLRELAGMSSSPGLQSKNDLPIFLLSIYCSCLVHFQVLTYPKNGRGKKDLDLSSVQTRMHVRRRLHS